MRDYLFSQSIQSFIYGLFIRILNGKINKEESCFPIFAKMHLIL